MCYAEMLRAIPSVSLEREYAGISVIHAEDTGVAQRIRLALLLSIPDTVFHDDILAQENLDKVLADTSHEAHQYQAIARLLRMTLKDYKNIEEELVKERRLRLTLQQKLDQLKIIEQDTGTRIPPKSVKEP